MHSEDIRSIENTIEHYIKGEEYKSWDPYDVLNSPLFGLSILRSN